MKKFDSMFNKFNGYMTYVGRVKTREVLLNSSDRLLEDAGLSRKLLESGVDAWPWRKPELAHTPLNFEHIGDVAAMRELQKYSDKELNDLGISRSSIPEAVINGRDGIDNIGAREAA